MADDAQELVGTWTVRFMHWTWEYTFSADGRVTWRDPLNNETGAGRWALMGKYLQFSWTGSSTKESWERPIRRLDQPGWCQASYGTGPLKAQKNLLAGGGGASTDPVKALREDADYVEQRVKGVGAPVLGGPFRLDIVFDFATAAPVKSFFMDRGKFSIALDPLKGRTEIALTGTIYDSEPAALAAVREFDVLGKDSAVYAHYRGPENVILPTIISSTTAPRLMRALRLVLEEERRFAQAASNLLLQAFFTLGGLRYGPTVNPSGGGAAAATDLAALRGTAQRLLSQQPAGRAVLNLAGTGEVSGAINVNPLIDQQVLSVPNLVQTTAESIGEVFPVSSVDKIVSNNVVLGQVNWGVTARGCFSVLKPGGTVSIAPYAGQLAEQIQVVVTALRSAGFKSVEVVHDTFVTAVK